ncbi:hypothetical protein K501DRAFT_282771 [Backusella circina FSU 941]|nr:hypothetical protein K501DRAFT_282771 [Backusella circina FSU 941]
MAGSTLSVIALLSLRSLLMSPSGRITAQASTKPLQHLKLLNYQPRSISVFSSTLPSYVHSRCA